MDNEADFVRFFCGCGQKLKAHIISRGKTLKCPKCGHPVRVPQESTRVKAEPAKSPRPPVVITPATGTSDTHYDVDLGVEPTAEAVGAAVEAPGVAGGKCPKCNAPTPLGAVLCVNCGLDFRTSKTARIIPPTRKKEH